MLNTIKQALKPAKQWLEYQRLPSSRPSGGFAAGAVGTCIISPDDPGSIGDAAMISAISERYGKAGLDVCAWDYPNSPRFPNTQGQVDVGKLRGASAEQVLSNYYRFGCVGADVMDGLYAYSQSCLRLRLLTLSAEMGLEARLFGFSFNADPHPKARLEFGKLHQDVVVCVRDPISHARLRRITDHPSRLVADLAFLVQGSNAYSDSARDALDWAEGQRAREGRRVVGLNVHPLFSFNHGAGITDALVRSFASLIDSRHGCSFLLIPHDFRPRFGDLPILKRLQAELSAEARTRVKLIEDISDPAILKGFVGNLDGILTGRMHLAIAALGKGVPVAGVTYQGKFEGLLQHFELTEGCTIAPPDAAQPDKLLRFFDSWLAQLESQARQVRLRLDAVTALSSRNFD